MTSKNLGRWAFVASVALQALLLPQSASAGDLYQETAVPLKRFGFATAGKYHTASEMTFFYNQTRQVLGDGAIVRTGMVWDPTRDKHPNFGTWSAEELELALERNITVLPVVTTNYVGGGYRMPTDAQYAEGLRNIVKMYGPNGTYKNGGSYVFNGKTYAVEPHPAFKGLFDYELWNEPNAEGNLGGAMTPLRVVQLVRAASVAMREEAARQGFKINIIAPAIGSIDIDYLDKLWQIDRNYFNYFDTLPFHAYIRFAPTQCSTTNGSKLRCVKSFDNVRSYLDSHGGAHIHLGVTESGTAGDIGLCLGPQVRSEQEQATISTENLLWLRGRPYLKFDLWILTNPVDRVGAYGYACDSGIYDIPYWETKLGVFRSNLTMKPWGTRLRELANAWR